MGTHLGPNVERTLELLGGYGVRRSLAQQAIEQAKHADGLTIFSVVDALTRMAQEIPYAGDRAAADATASRLLSLAHEVVTPHGRRERHERPRPLYALHCRHPELDVDSLRGDFEEVLEREYYADFPERKGG